MRKSAIFACAIAISALGTSAVTAESLRCKMAPTTGKNAEFIPSTIDITLDRDTGRIRVNHPLLVERGDPPTWGDISRESAQVLALTWKNFPIKFGYGGRRDPFYFRLSIQKATGAARLNTTKFNTGENPRGAGRCVFLPE